MKSATLGIQVKFPEYLHISFIHEEHNSPELESNYLSTRKTAALLAALTILATLLTGPPANAASGDTSDYVAEIQKELAALGYEGDTSEAALREEFESSPGYDTYGSDGGSSAHPLAAAPNGCSTPKVAKKLTQKWDKVFKSVCDSHDRCYGPSSKTDRKTCDIRFRNSMHNVCAFREDVKECKRVANVYYNAVRAFGKKNYKGKGSKA